MTIKETSKVVGTAWRLTKKNLGMLIGITVAQIGLTYLLEILTMGSKLPTGYFSAWARAINGDSGAAAEMAEMSRQMNESMPNMLPTIICMVVVLALNIGIMNIYVEYVRGRKESPSFNSFSMSVETYLKTFGSIMVVTLLATLSALCFVLPMIYVMPRVMWAPMMMLDNPEMGVMESVKESWRKTEGKVCRLLLYGVIAYGLALLGLLCCCVGLLVAEPMVMTLGAVVFVLLAGGKSAIEEKERPAEVVEI